MFQYDTIYFAQGGTSGANIGIAAVGISETFSTYPLLDTVDDLEGWSIKYGTSKTIYMPISVGWDIIANAENPFEEQLGGDFSIGVGVGTDLHATISKTETIFKFNLRDEYEQLKIKFNSYIDRFKNIFSGR